LSAAPLLGFTIQKRRLDGPRRYGVDEHAPRRDFARKGFGEPDDAGLARGVMTDGLAADLAELRGNIDDAAVAPLEHLADERARAEEDAAQVDVEDAVPILDRQILDERLGKDSGVVDEDVDPAEPGKRRRRHRPHAPLVAHIRMDEMRFAAVLSDAGENLAGMLLCHSVRDDEAGALAREGDGYPFADA